MLYNVNTYLRCEDVMTSRRATSYKKLENECNNYIEHLQKRIRRELRSMGLSEDTNITDSIKNKNPQLNTALNKKAAVEEIKVMAQRHQTLPAIKDKLQEHRKLIATRNDSWGMTFLKVCGTILSAMTMTGRFWQVKGKDFINTIDNAEIQEPVYNGL